MHTLPILQPGDSVEIIAPASRCSDKQLAELKALLISWQLNCIIQEDIFGHDLLCANTDALRFRSLKNALQNPATKAIICARGGYGSIRLIPELTKIIPSATPKLFVGMSDVTTLNLYLQQQWQWPVIHGSAALDKYSLESIHALKAILFGSVKQIEFSALPLNDLAKNNRIIETTITGGNLSLVQTSIGTTWQIDGSNKIIFLEETGERGYKIDRMLQHLYQANTFKNAAAILFGDFIEGKEPNGSTLIKPVLERFAEHCEIPVLQAEGIGHGYTNFPLPLGINSRLQLGQETKLICNI
jgi:muramoyltetrapeptide carboxypeptidase